jgi:PAS domain S-box-containing protein
VLTETIERGEFLRALVDALDDAVITTINGEITSWNHAAEVLFGYTAEEIMGRSIADMLAWAPQELFADTLMADLRRGAKPGFECKIRTTGEQELWLSCTVAALPSLEADTPTIMYMFRDIGQARELEYLKDELLSSVSHELRTPLNGIYGFARLLLERPHMSERMRTEALESLQASIERLTRVADDFAAVARTPGGRWPLQLEQIDIAQVVRSAVEEGKRRHPDHTIRLRIQRTVLNVWGDSLRIKQILAGLLSNAAKYSPVGTVISIGVRCRGDMIAISVSDRGAGVPENAKERIFEAFYRADNSRHQRATGVGLGLTVVKSLVEAHEGQITVQSSLGCGSTFTFTLPIYGSPNSFQHTTADQLST